MLSQKVERLLPRAEPERLFDIAADVERYPEFLRWWIAARVERREVNAYYTEQVLGLGPLRVRFSSKTILERPARIEVISHEPPFRRFGLIWAFTPEPSAGCRVSLAAELELHSGLLQRLVAAVLPGAVADIVAAFEARTRELEALAARTRPGKHRRHRGGPR